jgi:hypothetical protein
MGHQFVHALIHRHKSTDKAQVQWLGGKSRFGRSVVCMHIRSPDVVVAPPGLLQHENVIS